MKQDSIIETIVLAPPFDRDFIRAEHPEGELEFMGDALGCDCMVVRFIDGWTRMYSGDGSRNEDWYSWGVEALAPCSGTVEQITEPQSTNQPGSHQGGQSGSITIQREDGVRVLYGHVDNVCVRIGDRVETGQPLATVGNNGFSWNPHLHIGAWREETPLQIRFDLHIQGQRASETPDYWGGQLPKLDDE